MNIKNTKSHVITCATKRMIRERESLKKSAQKDLTLKKDYYDFRKKVKKEIRKDVRNFELMRIDEAIKNNQCLKIAREGIYPKRKYINCLKDKNGIIQTDPSEIENIVTSFYSDLYQSKNSQEESLLVQFSSQDFIQKIELCEIKEALKRMKFKKSCGPDNFPIDLIKICDDSVLEKIVDIFNVFLTTEEIPKEWTNSEIILIFKKGKKDEIKNYRPLSMISHLYKLFIQIIIQRIDPLLDDEQSKNQAGFRKGYSTTDHLTTLNQLIEKSKEFQQEVFIAFIDYEKAFDCVEISKLLEALEEFKIPRKYIRLLKNIYDHSTASIKLQKSSKEFNITRGVKQGDPISPKLFNAILEFIFRKLDWKEMGVKIFNEFLNNLRFADDVTLISNSENDILKMIKDLKTESEKCGLLMNKEKTKIMTNSSSKDFIIDDWKIDKVDDFRYLGQNVSFISKTDKELDTRISAAWRSFWSLKKFLLSNLPMSHKQKLMDTIILPILTYGAQTWTLTVKDENKLQAEQKAMERRILKISLIQHHTNAEIREITKIKDVLIKARELKWDWAGHTQRMEDFRWPKLLINWFPQNSKRKRGHQVKRWSDDIEKIGLGRWREKAQDRKLWKNLRETFVQLD